MELMARLGVGLMVIAQKPWETAEAELAAYRKRYLEFNGTEAPKPILVVVCGVSRDPKQTDRMRDVYLQRWARSTVDHYEFDNVGFAEIEGYEYYAALANNIAKHGLDRFNGFLADLQVWGTPERGDREAARLRTPLRRRRPRDPGDLRRHAPRRSARQLSSSSPPKCCPSSSATTSAGTSA